MIERRAFLTGLAAVICAPAIVRATSLMPVKAFGKFVNVKWFGAVGDGIADDTAAFMRALGVVQTGGTIYFPAGTYRAPVFAALPLPRILITGEGWSQTIIKEPAPPLRSLLVAQAHQGCRLPL